jgi:hypothetical protein
MATVSVVFQSGGDHTRRQAEAIAQGADSIEGVAVEGAPLALVSEAAPRYF